MMCKRNIVTALSPVAFLLVGTMSAHGGNLFGAADINKYEMQPQSTTLWRAPSGEKQIRSKLRKLGYRHIWIDRNSGQDKSALVCMNNQQIRLELNSVWGVKRLTQMGRCPYIERDQVAKARGSKGRALRKASRELANNNSRMRSRLEELGYERISMASNSTSSKTAQACMNDKMFRFEFNRSGGVRRIGHLGKCAQGPFDNITTAAIGRHSLSKAAKVYNMLALSGYNHIKIDKRSRKLKSAHACRSGKMMRLYINNENKVARARSLGSCVKPRHADSLATGSLPNMKAMKSASIKAATLQNSLMLSGYNRIRIDQRGSKIVSADVCSSSTMMRLDIDNQGKVASKTRIGNCYLPGIAAAKLKQRVKLAKAKAHALRNSLMLSGYNRIRIDQQGAGIVAADACLSDAMMRFNIDSQGKVANKTRVGSCYLPGIAAAKLRQRAKIASNASNIEAMRAASMQSGALRNSLMLSGYNRIRIDQRGSRIVTADACRSDAMMRLEIDSKGRVERMQRVGTCYLPGMVVAKRKQRIKMARAKAKTLRNSLMLSGYNHIKIAAGDPWVKSAQVCRSEKMMGLDIDRDGKVTRVNRIGTCSDERYDDIVTAAIPGKTFVAPTPKRELKSIRNYLRSKGYNRIDFVDRTVPHYEVNACQKEKLMRINMRDSGFIIRESRIGTCSYGGYRPQVAFSAQVSNAMSAAAGLHSKQRKRRAQRNAMFCSNAFKGALQAEPVQFSVGSTRLSRKSLGTLDRLALIGGYCPNAKVKVEVHTDSDGSAMRNRRLSRLRAHAVVSYLIKKGMKWRQLSAVGYGEGSPVVSNNSLSNKALNRRIELVAYWH